MATALVGIVIRVELDDVSRACRCARVDPEAKPQADCRSLRGATGAECGRGELGAGAVPSSQVCPRAAIEVLDEARWTAVQVALIFPAANVRNQLAGGDYSRRVMLFTRGKSNRATFILSALLPGRFRLPASGRH